MKQTNMNPFFEYERTPVFTEINGSKLQLPKEVIVNTESLHPVGVVSKNYALIPNIELANIFEDAFQKYEVSNTWDYIQRGGEAWVRRIIFNDDRLTMEVKNDDTIKVGLEIFNSYSGKSSYGARLFGMREICDNGVVWGRENLISFKFTHMSNNLDVIKKTFEITASDVTESVLPIWKEWVKTKFTIKDMENFLETRDYITSEKNKEKILVKYEEIMNREFHEETKWAAFNTLTYISTHETKATRKDTSHIFSNAYRKYERLASDFYTI